MIDHLFERSSNVRRVVLDEPSGVAEVTFVSGVRYRYEGFSKHLIDEWLAASSAGSWFSRVIKGNPHRYRPLRVEPTRPKLEVEIADARECLCIHELLRSLNGGSCPVCDAGVASEPSEKSEERILDVPRDEVPSGLPQFNPVSPATVRPPVEPLPSSPVPGEAHGLRRPLATLTRKEATRLLTRLRARRMRDSLRAFIRGDNASGKWEGGAWSVVEAGVELEWNWHHDAICMHVQCMLEEWVLAGIQNPADVRAQIEAWIGRRRMPGLEFELELAESYLAHWTTTGADRYKQRLPDLAINVGPISLKSRICMVMVPAWMWLDTPTWEVFCASGTPSNVSRDSLACRDLVQHVWYRETFDVKWTIREDLNRVDKWATTAGGVRESRGAGGAVTGVHADAICVDDCDDAAKVWSEAERRDAWTFMLAVGNRLNDLTRPLRLTIQQNLHEEDVTSKLVKNGVARLAIPIEFAPADRDKLYTAPLKWRDPRKTVGELLHATRFPPEVIAAERKRLGTHGFEAQYNCNPRPLDGGMIKRSWFNFFRIEDELPIDRPRPMGCRGSGGDFGELKAHPPLVLKQRRGTPPSNDIAWMPGRAVANLDLDWVTISVDATFGSLKDTASAVGLLCCAGKALRRFVLDDRSEPMTFHGTVAAVKTLVGKWPAKRVIIEVKANGAAVIEELTLLMRDAKLLGVDGKPAIVVVEGVNPDGGKESRAAAMVPAIESGMVYLLEGAEWLEAFVGEVCVFPNAKRDDRVDSLSQLMARYRDSDVVGKWRSLSQK